MALGRPKQFVHDEVLARATEVFWQQGYEGTSVPDLVSSMGISRQSLYDTFGSKRGLYICAIEHYRNTQLVQALALLEREASPLENVRSVVSFFQDLAADARCRGCFVANAVVEIGSHDREIARLLHETLEYLRAKIELSLECARERGEISPRKCPQQLSRALVNAMIGLAVTGKLGLGQRELGEIYTGTLSMLD